MNKVFLLKLIILAESDNETYRYLKDRQDLIPEIEKNDFKEEYKNKRAKKNESELEKLELTRKLLQLPPHSNALSAGELAELFYRVGFYEEPTPDPREFLLYAKTNPNEAMKFLEKIPGSWMHFSAQIVPELDKVISDLQGDAAKLDDSNIVNPVKKMFKTFFLTFSKYGNNENKENRNLFDSTCSLPIRLSNNAFRIIDNETDFFNLCLSFGSTECLQQYLSLPRFDDFNNFNQVILNLDQKALAESGITKSILDKVYFFLGANFDATIPLIREKKMLMFRNSEEFRNQLLTFFTSHGEPQRTVLFDLLKVFLNSEVNKISLIDDLLNKHDCEKLSALLADESYISILSTKRNIELKQFITKDMDLNETQCTNLLTNLWTDKKLGVLGFLDKNFLTEFGNKINAIQDFDTKKPYIELLSNKNLVETILSIGAKGSYLEVLNFLNNNLKGNNHSEEGKKISLLKRSVTSFLTKMKGGVKHGRRSGTTGRNSRNPKQPL